MSPRIFKSRSAPFAVSITICISSAFGPTQSVEAYPLVNLLPHPVALSSGGATTCALISDGTVDCWGDNSYGKAGDLQPNAGTNPPTVVQGFDGAVKAISAGMASNCALLVSGEVQCWGGNTEGELGNTLDYGTTIAHPHPLTVTGLAGPAIAIAGGRCALVQAPTNTVVQCWGPNDSWQLGNSVVPSSGTPIPQVVPQTQGATAIAASGRASCALMPATVLPATGGILPASVKCWGDNTLGELGLGFVSPSGPTQADSDLLPGATVQLAQTMIAVHSSPDADAICAQVADGSLFCWGQNDFAQLGSGFSGVNATVIPRPVLVAGTNPGGGHPIPVSSSAETFSTGFDSSCAISSGSVLCWGKNDEGQLGLGFASGIITVDGGTPPPIQLPTKTLVTKNATSVSVGDKYACAIVSQRVECWGHNVSYGKPVAIALP